MTEHWQEWMVYALLGLCALGIGKQLFHFVRGVRNKRYPCDSCADGCNARGLYDERRPECREAMKKKKKKKG